MCAAFAGLFAGGAVAGPSFFKGCEGVVRENGKEMRATIQEAKGAAGQFLVEVEETVEYIIKDFGAEVEKVAGNLDRHAQIIIEKAGVEARLLLQAGLEGTQQMLRIDVPYAARMVAKHGAEGGVDAVNLKFGRMPADSLMSHVYELMHDPKSTPLAVVERINRAPVDQKEKLKSYEMAFLHYGMSLGDSTASFTWQVWLLAEAKMEIEPPERSALSRLLFSKPDIWERFETKLNHLPTCPKTRSAVLAELRKLPLPRKSKAFKEMLGTLGDLLMDLPLSGTPIKPATITADMRKGLIDAIKEKDVPEAERLHALMTEIDPASFRDTIVADSTLTSTEIVSFVNASKNQGGIGERVLEAFAGSNKDIPTSFSDIVSYAACWKGAFPHRPAPFESKLVAQAKQECSRYMSANFDPLAKKLINLNEIISQNGMLQLVDGLVVSGTRERVAKSSSVFKLVHSLLQMNAKKELLECFDPAVVVLVQGEKRFFLENRNGLMDAEGPLWSGGPGRYCVVETNAPEKNYRCQIFRSIIHGNGHCFSFRSSSDLFLEGGRIDWSGGPSFHVTSHEEEHLDRRRQFHKWKITPLSRNKFKITNLEEDRVLNGNGKRTEHGNEATVEEGSRGEGADREWSILLR